MKSAWVDSDAKAAVDHWAKAGVTPELALRVYSTRLLGREPKLVLHGGGNTSVKVRTKDLLDDEVDVLRVKGSGWDMASIEPAGMPAVRLDALRKLRTRTAMPDEEMVRVQRAALSIRSRQIHRWRRSFTPSFPTNLSTIHTRLRSLA
mgnify:CR=1 FL=1